MYVYICIFTYMGIACRDIKVNTRKRTIFTVYIYARYACIHLFDTNMVCMYVVYVMYVIYVMYVVYVRYVRYVT